MAKAVLCPVCKGSGKYYISLLADLTSAAGTYEAYETLPRVWGEGVDRDKRGNTTVSQKT